MKPSKVPAPKLPEHSIIHGDEIYFSHPEHGPLCGPVCAIGKDGCQVEHELAGDARYLPVTWDRIHGHKARKERAFTLIDRGEDGAIAQDENGRRVYIHGDIPDDEHNPTSKAMTQPIPMLFLKARPTINPPAPQEPESPREEENPEPQTKRPVLKHGYRVRFKAGEHEGEGSITAIGDDGVTVQDDEGREHGIHHNELTHYKRCKPSKTS